MPSFTATELIAGTKGTKGIKTVTPEAVAQAILRGVDKDRKDVFVPGSVGTIVKITPLLGRRLRDALNRSIGAYDTFLDVDHGARAAYDTRITGEAGSGLAMTHAASHLQPSTETRVDGLQDLTP